MLKKLKWSVILYAIAEIAAGVLLIMYPALSSDVICYMTGVGAIVYGLFSLVTYFLLGLEDSLFRNEFVHGIMALLAGIIIMVKKDVIIDLIPVVLGMIIVYSGFGKLQQALVAWRIRYQKAGWFAGLGIISIIAGLYVMFFMTGKQTQEILFRTIGGGLVYCGVSDLIMTLFLTNRFSKYVEDFKSGKVMIEEQIKKPFKKEEKEEPDTNEADLFSNETAAEPVIPQPEVIDAEVIGEDTAVPAEEETEAE